MPGTYCPFCSYPITTHNVRNHPVIIAGGRARGLEHGTLRRYTENAPFSNVLPRIAQASGSNHEKLADSTGVISEI